MMNGGPLNSEWLQCRVRRLLFDISTYEYPVGLLPSVIGGCKMTQRLGRHQSTFHLSRNGFCRNAQFGAEGDTGRPVHRDLASLDTCWEDCLIFTGCV